MARDSGTLIDIRHPSGRPLWCWKYVASYTYDGMSIRTSSESCNEHMLESTEREAGRCFGEWPMHIIQPHRRPGEIDYPKVRFIAFFTSHAMREEMHLSSLVLVWFQHQQHPVPDEAALVALRSVDWEKLAVDYET